VLPLLWWLYTSEGLGWQIVLAFAKKILFALTGSRKMEKENAAHDQTTNRPIVQVRILSELDGASGETEQVFSSKWVKADKVGGWVGGLRDD
jgi:hypothetical protein